MGNGALTLGQAAAFCGGRLREEFREIPFYGANFDTRRLQKGELFVAIVGQRNGHDFAAFAMEQGAAGVLASQPLGEDIPAIYVEDTLAAMQAIARGRREELNCPCIAVTGSVGKTTTKEMIAAVLETTFHTEKTAANFNNELGLPVTVLGLTEQCEAAVLELGMNHFGELSRLTAIAQPDVAVITNIGTMHIENLGSREGILRAKLELLEGLRPNGAVFFNGNDDLLAPIGEKYGAKLFGTMKNAHIRGTEIRTVGEETHFTVEADGIRFPVILPVTGEHHVIDALGAVAVGLHMGVSSEAIAAGLAGFRNTGMRQRIYERNGVCIIEDCYNAGPESMAAALNVLAQREGRKIAVLGGMLELGDYSRNAHMEVGRKTATIAQMLLCYGGDSPFYVQGALERGGCDAACFDTHEALARELKQRLCPGDVLLIKGSRGMRMERVLPLLFDESE